MPEGDSVHQLARRLHFLVGREVLHSQLRVPRYALVDFSGRQVDAVWAYGKNLYMRFGDDVLHTHLKMDGQWAMHLAGDRWRHPGHTARVILQVDGTPHPRPIEVVGHSLGLVEVFAYRDYQQRIAHFGPDLLHGWDPVEATRRLRARPSRMIGTALLDQRVLAGVGNEYRAEICFLAGVHPARRVAEVDVPRIVQLAHKLLEDNKEAPVRVSTGVRGIGQSTYVYGREGQPCRRCRTPIELGALAEPGGPERLIWWCPTCQPEPGASPAGRGTSESGSRWRSHQS